MPTKRYDTVNQVKAAYEEYYRLIDSVRGSSTGSGSFGGVASNFPEISQLALRLAIAEAFAGE